MGADSLLRRSCVPESAQTRCLLWEQLLLFLTHGHCCHCIWNTSGPREKAGNVRAKTENTLHDNKNNICKGKKEGRRNNKQRLSEPPRCTCSLHEICPKCKQPHYFWAVQICHCVSTRPEMMRKWLETGDEKKRVGSYSGGQCRPWTQFGLPKIQKLLDFFPVVPKEELHLVEKASHKASQSSELSDQCEYSLIRFTPQSAQQSQASHIA